MSLGWLIGLVGHKFQVLVKIVIEVLCVNASKAVAEGSLYTQSSTYPIDPLNTSSSQMEKPHSSTHAGTHSQTRPKSGPLQVSRGCDFIARLPDL